MKAFFRKLKLLRSKRAIAQKAERFRGGDRFDSLELAGIRFERFASPSGYDDSSRAPIVLYSWKGECHLGFWGTAMKIAFCTSSKESHEEYGRFLHSLLAYPHSIRPQVEDRLVDYFQNELSEESGLTAKVPSTVVRNEVLNVFGAPTLLIEDPSDSLVFTLEFIPELGRGYPVKVEIVDWEVTSVR